jgi:hypothetical protein
MAGGVLAGWAHQGGPGDFAISLSRLDGIFWGKLWLHWDVWGVPFTALRVKFGKVFAKVQNDVLVDLGDFGNG